MCGGIKIIILHISPQYGTFYHYTGVDGVAAWAVHNASLIAITRKFEFMNYYSAPYEYMLPAIKRFRGAQELWLL